MLLVCCSLGYVAAQNKKVNCDEKLEVLNDAVNNMLMVINENVLEYPTVQDFDDEYCIPFSGWFRGFSGYKPCLKSFTRTLVSFIGVNIKKLHKQFCLSEENKVIAFNHLRCMVPKTKPVFNDIGRQVKNFVSYIVELPQVDDMIPAFCCGYLNVTTTMIPIMETTCVQQGKTGSGIFMGNIVKSTLSDAVDMICGKYSKVEDCRTPKLSQMMDAMAQRLTETKNLPLKSLISQVLVIFKRLDSDLNVD